MKFLSLVILSLVSHTSFAADLEEALINPETKKGIVCNESECHEFDVSGATVGDHISGITATAGGVAAASLGVAKGTASLAAKHGAVAASGAAVARTGNMLSRGAASIGRSGATQFLLRNAGKIGVIGLGVLGAVVGGKYIWDRLTSDDSKALISKYGKKAKALVKSSANRSKEGVVDEADFEERAEEGEVLEAVGADTDSESAAS